MQKRLAWGEHLPPCPHPPGSSEPTAARLASPASRARPAAGMSEELGAPNDPSLCSSRGSLIRYNSVSRTPSHTETSQGVLQAGDHVESNQIPIKMSSGCWQAALAIEHPHAREQRCPSPPSLPLPHRDGPPFSSTPDTWHGMARDGTSTFQPDTALPHRGPHQAFMDHSAPQPLPSEGHGC